MQKFKITTEAYQNIIKKIGSGIPEKGGVLMGKDDVVTHFIFDKDAQTTGSTYSLNIAYLNPKMKELTKQGYRFMGIIHSHPYGSSKLSNPDRMYFYSQFKNFPELEWMYTPIVFSAKQNEYELFPYIFHKDGSIEESTLEILPNDYETYLKKESESQSHTTSQTYKTCVKIFQIFNHPQAEIKKPALSESETQLAMLFIALYFFVLGVCFGILPIALVFIIKNILNL